MQNAKKNSCYENQKVVFVKITDIKPNPAQPRKVFEKDSLQELATSIAQHGILQPLSVRRTEDGIILIAGERRLKAAKLAGLSEVPCICMDVDGQQASLFALIENLQRQDLDYIEEAEGIARLMRLYGLSQDEAAKKLGKAQPTVANKLRLLKLSPAVLLILREQKLTERHARALLRLEKEQDRLDVLQYVIKNKLSVAKTESYIDRFLQSEAEKREKSRCTYIIKDIRIFLNTISHSLEVMQDAGVGASMVRHENDEEIELTITIPKLPSAMAEGKGA
ncbi:MAG: ParB/RepB/Spo0J family partition protein [Clostridiales bacterium]|nr:ParB/RepB/Spo0J family partition protein [Clostridiales bacterium]